MGYFSSRSKDELCAKTWSLTQGLKDGWRLQGLAARCPGESRPRSGRAPCGSLPRTQDGSCIERQHSPGELGRWFAWILSAPATSMAAGTLREHSDTRWLHVCAALQPASQGLLVHLQQQWLPPQLAQRRPPLILHREALGTGSALARAGPRLTPAGSSRVNGSTPAWTPPSPGARPTPGQKQKMYRW